MDLWLQGRVPVALSVQILDCMEVIDHVHSLFLSGWAVARGWTKIAGWLEGPSPEVFLNVCSSKLVRRATFALRDSNSSWNGHHGEHALHLPCFLLGVGCCRLFGDLYFNMMQVCMLFTMDGCMCVDANVCTCTLVWMAKTHAKWICREFML